MLALTDLTLLVSLALAVLLVTPFLGRYMAAVMEGQRTFLSPVLRPVERGVYRVCGIDETSEQGWKGYSVALLLFSLVGIVLMYAMLRLQDILPLNPNANAAFSPELVVQHGHQLRDQHQLAELLGRGRQPPHPVRRPRRAQLHVGRGGHRHRRGPHPRASSGATPRRSATSGSTSRARSCTSCCPSRSSAPSCWPGRASPRRSTAPPPRPRCRAPSRPSPAARSPPRRSSRSSAPTAAGRSTRTRPTRSRTPTA